MNGPFPFRREVASLDAMLESIGGEGWEGLDKLFHPAEVPDRFDPGAEVKKPSSPRRSARRPAARRSSGSPTSPCTRAVSPCRRIPQAAAIAAAKHERASAVGG